MTDKSKKTVILGVTGGIAAYKSPTVCRSLAAAGCDVRVVMTRNACKIISPHALAAVSGNPVSTNLFPRGEAGMRHISLSKDCDLLLVAPATANIIGKFAHGIADDLLSTVFISTDSPKVIAPAMNFVMYANPIVQRNIALLKEIGVVVIEPEEGPMADGREGLGRMPAPEKIAEVALKIMA